MSPGGARVVHTEQVAEGSLYTLYYLGRLSCLYSLFRLCRLYRLYRLQTVWAVWIVKTFVWTFCACSSTRWWCQLSKALSAWGCSPDSSHYSPGKVQAQHWQPLCMPAQLACDTVTLLHCDTVTL